MPDKQLRLYESFLKNSRMSAELVAGYKRVYKKTRRQTNNIKEGSTNGEKEVKDNQRNS